MYFLLFIAHVPVYKGLWELMPQVCQLKFFFFLIIVSYTAVYNQYEHNHRYYYYEFFHLSVSHRNLTEPLPISL